MNIEDERYCHTMGQQVCNDIFTRYQQEIDISHIQKIVENTLMAGKYPEIARAYIEYRHDRDLARENAVNSQKKSKG